MKIDPRKIDPDEDLNWILEEKDQRFKKKKIDEFNREPKKKFGPRIQIEEPELD